MITMGGFSLPSKTLREMIVSSIDVVVQAARLRDGSRRITHCHRSARHGRRRHHHAGPVHLRHDREDANGRIIGRHRSTGIGRPAFWDRARYTAKSSGSRPALDAADTGEGQQ
jgi:pilus assembly protein CpaF